MFDLANILAQHQTKCYEKKVYTAIVNNSSNINNTKTVTSHQIIEQKRPQHVTLNIQVLARVGTTYGGIKPVNVIPILPS